MAGWQKPQHSLARTLRCRHCIFPRIVGEGEIKPFVNKNSIASGGMWDPLMAVGWGGVGGEAEQNPFSETCCRLLLYPLMQRAVYSRSPIEHFSYSLETSPVVRTPGCTCPHICSDT